MSSISQEAASGYAWPPSIMGFDVPSPAPGADGSLEPVMVAFLSTRPDHYWVEAFVSEVGDFKLRHQLADVRIDYRCLVIHGSLAQLRHLTTELRSFVQRVSRISLQRRVMDRLGPRDTSIPEGADHAAAVRDVNLVAQMPGIAAILEAVSRETGMRFATVARVTDTRWTACAVHDTINFGLRAGQDLALETTICNEIRQHGHTVVFNHASTHPVYSNHPTPALYGFESYISVPIYRANGQLFGTLCAVDPEPRQLDEATVKQLEDFARAIGQEIDRTDPSPPT